MFSYHKKILPQVHYICQVFWGIIVEKSQDFNAFSKKIENLEYAVALHFMYYNFARSHKTLTNPYPKTPAMAAGLTNHIWTIEEIVQLVRGNPGT
jgi:hypothetical protein